MLVELLGKGVGDDVYIVILMNLSEGKWRNY